MDKSSKTISKMFFASVFAVLLLVCCSINAESVRAASPRFNMDSYNMSVGDLFYVPYATNGVAGTEYYVEEDLMDYVSSSEYKAIWLYGDDSNHYGYNTLIGQYPGSTTVYALDAYGEEYDSMAINVTERPAFSLYSPTTVILQPGQIVRSFRVIPAETNTYHFTIQGTHYSEIYVSTYDYGQLVGHSAGNGTVTTLDIQLEASKEYYIDFTTFDINATTFHAPNAVVSLNVTVTRDAKPTGISLLVNAYPLKAEGDTYYMLEGDTLDLAVVFEGGPNVENENYAIGSTNSFVASVSNGVVANSHVLTCHTSGTVDVSVTSASMFTDSIKVVVIGQKDLIPGDVDLDFAITTNDIYNVYTVVKGLAEKTRIYYHADLNGDGVLDDEDIKLMWESVGGLPYIDVAETDWFYDEVEYNYNEKTMTGMNSIQFGPYESLSRAQFALILYRMQGTPEVAVENPFTDIMGNEWYADAVLWAFDHGIVNGFGDNSFRPADLITREQMVAMMYRYANYLEEDTSVKESYDDFADADTVSEYAAEAMQWAVGNGILTGKVSDEGAMLAPWGATARAEAAAIIQRYMEK